MGKKTFRNGPEGEVLDYHQQAIKDKEEGGMLGEVIDFRRHHFEGRKPAQVEVISYRTGYDTAGKTVTLHRLIYTDGKEARTQESMTISMKAFDLMARNIGYIKVF